MSFKFKEVVTTEYEVHSVIMNFMSLAAFRNVRKDTDKCGLCYKKLGEGEGFVHLAMISEHRNRLFCSECAEAAIRNGAERMGKG